MKSIQDLMKLWSGEPPPPAPRPPEGATLAAAPVIVAQSFAPVTTSPAPLDPAQAGERLAPFLDRTRAELAGVYCRPLAWPDGGALVADPGDHWRRYGDRLADVADVLRPLALAYATPPDGWPVAPHLYLWEYSRLVAWFKADPCELPAQVEAWRGTVTPYRNPLMNPPFFDGHKAQEGLLSPPEVQRDDRA